MISPGTQTLERAVRAYVAKGSGLDRQSVIRGQENAPFPDLPVATVTLITDLPEGFAWTRDERIENREYSDPAFTDGPTIDETAFLSSELSYSVQWFGAYAADYARRFSVWAASPAGTSEAARRGLVFYRTSPIRDLTGLHEEDWEDRRGLDLFLGIVSTIVSDVGILETADISIFPERLAEETPPDDHISVPIPSAKQLASS